MSLHLTTPEYTLIIAIQMHGAVISIAGDMDELFHNVRISTASNTFIEVFRSTVQQWNSQQCLLNKILSPNKPHDELPHSFASPSFDKIYSPEYAKNWHRCLAERLFWRNDGIYLLSLAHRRQCIPLRRPLNLLYVPDLHTFTQLVEMPFTISFITQYIRDLHRPITNADRQNGYQHIPLTYDTKSHTITAIKLSTLVYLLKFLTPHTTLGIDIYDFTCNVLAPGVPGSEQYTQFLPRDEETGHASSLRWGGRRRRRTRRRRTRRRRTRRRRTRFY